MLETGMKFNQKKVKNYYFCPYQFPHLCRKWCIDMYQVLRIVQIGVLASAQGEEMISYKI